MDKFEYVPATFGASTVQMDGPVAFVGTADNVRSRSWNRELGKDNLLSASRTAREVEVEFTTDYAIADGLREAADADVLARTPGTFVAQGEWKQRGYILESQPSSISFGWLSTTLTIALLDGAWWRLRGVSFTPTQNQTPSGGLDYPYDYPHGYSRPTSGGSVYTGRLVPCKPRIVFYGPVRNPKITIAGNKYQVNANVTTGARIEVDGRDKTVTLITSDGTATDKFSDALRGSGEGGGEYIFQPIPPGDNVITWDGTFGIDVMWYDEVGEPPWSQS